MRTNQNPTNFRRNFTGRANQNPTNFRSNFTGVLNEAEGFTEDKSKMLKNPMGYVLGLLSVGILVYVIGYSFKSGQKKA